MASSSLPKKPTGGFASNDGNPSTTNMSPAPKAGVFKLPPRNTQNIDATAATQQAVTSSPFEFYKAGAQVPSTNIFSRTSTSSLLNATPIKQESIFSSPKQFPVFTPAKPDATNLFAGSSTPTPNSLFSRPGGFMTTNSPLSSVSTTSFTSELKKKTIPMFRAGDECVVFLIGEEEKKFYVHKGFAVYYSPALKAAFENPEFMEAETKKYRMRNTEEGEFVLFVQWLYTQKLECDELTTATHFIRLWILAKDLNIRRLQNEAIDQLEKMRIGENKVVPASVLKFVYENTTVDSALRKYVVDDYTVYSVAEDFTTDSELIPHQLLLDSMVFFKTNMIQKRVTKVFGVPSHKIMSDFYVGEN